MWIFIIIIIIILLILILPKEENNNKKEKVESEDYTKFVTNNYVMTQTELKFYRKLKKITDELDMTIFPQVDLERIINVIDNNKSDRGKIKSRSIDYTIVENSKCKIVCCIELDDYTHNKENVKKVDEFKNKIFEKVKIPLHRVKVSNDYNEEELKKILQKDIQI